MTQIYKIYMNESALIIGDFSPISDSTYEVLDSQEFDFGKLYRENINFSGKHQFYVQNAAPARFLEEILSKVKFIKAAGGLVENAQRQYLFIKRLGKWDLPKGKVEGTEKMREAALREVEEECGITVDVLGEKLMSTYHSYSMSGELIIKKTNWYAMQVHSNPVPSPQQEEGITEARWLDKADLGMVRENTYPLIQELISTL